MPDITLIPLHDLFVAAGRNRSSSQVPPAEHSRLVLSSRTRRILLILLLLGMALVPRLLHLADFYTYDEAEHWVQRSQAFAEAVRTHDWAATNQTGHPGVTTMWLGALGVWLSRGETSGTATTGAMYLAMLRFPVALVNGLVVVLGYVLARRLVGERVALLAGLLWAASPFVIAHSRVLHVDGLLTSWMSLSILLLLNVAPPHLFRRGSQPTSGAPAEKPSRSWIALIGSGMCAGLALLTKSPSLILLPCAGLWLLWISPGRLSRRLTVAALRMSVWMAAGALVVLALWPAMWVDPVRSIQSVYAELLANGGRAHPDGSFFFGQPVSDPGWLFYPVVLVWRSDPLTLIGLALLPLALWRRGGKRRYLLALGGFVLLFGVVMSVGPKKFDRYLLPIWPAIELLAAVGLARAYELCQALAARWNPHLARISGGALLRQLGGATVCAALIGGWASYHPYELAYFNPLLGGSATGSRVLLVGWGEGLDVVGRWLRDRPDLAIGPIMARNPLALQPFVLTKVLDMTPGGFKQPVNYAVLYISNVERREDQAIATRIRQTQPLATVTLHGITYATIYQLPRPYTRTIDAVYGETLHLRGISQTQVGSTLIITPSWDIQANQPGGLMAFVHVIATDGRRVAQADAPLDQGLFSTWQAGQQFGFPLQIALPTAATGSSYRIVFGIYERVSGERVPVTRGARLPESVDGPEVIQLAPSGVP